MWLTLCSYETPHQNMVCNRCIMVVTNELESLGIQPVSVTLGEVDLGNTQLSEQQQHDIDKTLQPLGFERIDDRKSQLIQKVKNFVIEQIHYADGERLNSWSDLITEEVNHSYSYVSNLFSSVEGVTLEQYIILQKIEKVKELLVYDELTLSQIAYKLDYSSVAHLSRQFKKVTGFTPSRFKQLKGQNRKPLDEV